MPHQRSPIDAPDSDDVELKSKTQVKEEMHALRQLGLQIAELPLALLDTLEMSTELRAAIEDYRRISHKNALKRQASYIGKVLRNDDADALREQLERIQQDRHRATRQLHLVEQWRDKLIDEASSIDTFIRQVPNCDRQQLRSVIRAAVKEKQTGKAKANARKLFKLIQGWLAERDSAT